MLVVANVVLTEHNTAVLGRRLVKAAPDLLITVSHDEKVLGVHLAAALLHVVYHKLDKGCCENYLWERSMRREDNVFCDMGGPQLAGRQRVGRRSNTINGNTCCPTYEHRAQKTLENSAPTTMHAGCWSHIVKGPFPSSP